jgi:hypothetical protein
MDAMHSGDELNQYLRGDSPISRRYRSEEAPLPPAALDRVVLQQLHGGGKSQCLAPLAFAACVLLSLALVAAVVLKPAGGRHALDAPRVMPARLYSETADARPPSEWLAEIAALRHAGRRREAAEEMQRFHSAYPHYIVPSDE